MNEQLCKYLRKVAKAIGEGAKYPPRELLQKKNDNPFEPFRGTIFNSPKSVRGVYRHLKKQARIHYGNHPRRTETTPSS